MEIYVSSMFLVNQRNSLYIYVLVEMVILSIILFMALKCMKSVVLILKTNMVSRLM